MNRRLLSLVLILVGLLWVSFRMGSGPDHSVKPAAQQGERGGGASTDTHRTVDIHILPSSPTLQSRLRVASDSPIFNPSAYQYRWFVNKKEVGSGETLSLERFHQGDIISVEITPKEAAGPVQPATASVKIGNTPPVVREVRLVPIPVYAGEAVRAEVTAEDADQDFIQLTYEWQINGQPLPNDRDTLDGSHIHSADTLLVFVTPSDPFSKGVPSPSLLVTVSNRSPEILSTPPRLDQKGAYRYPVIARDPDGDALSYRLLDAPPGMNIDTTGVLSWSVTLLPTKQAGVSIEVSDGKGGKVIQQLTLRTEPAPSQ